MKHSVLVLFAFVSLMSCGNSKEVYRTVLDGYQGERLRVKLDEKLEEIKLEDGSDGYLMTTLVDYSEGGSKSQATATKVWMQRNFTLVRKENRIFKDGKEVSLETTSFDGEKIHFSHTGTEGKNMEESMPWGHPEPPIGEIHALLFTKDLTAPNTQKSYWIFFEPMRGPAPDRVKRGEKMTVTIGGKSYDCVHYGIRSMTIAGHYNDYYIEEGTNKTLKIVVGNIEFTPPGTRD